MMRIARQWLARYYSPFTMAASLLAVLLVVA